MKTVDKLIVFYQLRDMMARFGGSDEGGRYFCSRFRKYGIEGEKENTIYVAIIAK